MSRARLIGEPLEVHLPQLALLLLEAGPQGTVRRAEITALRDDGAVRNLGISAAPLADHTGGVIGRVIHFQDLTELRRMQLEVERAERLASIGRLAAGIAHEIRNPLASISGSIEMLKTTPGADADSRQLMDIAVREVDRLNRLITDLLDYARPHKEERRRLDLGEHAGEIVRAFEQERREKITVAVELPAGVMVEAAPGQLRQVLWNLIRNAADAMSTSGGGEIAIRLGTDGPRAALAIRDQGPGIPRDRLDRTLRAVLLDQGRRHRPGPGDGRAHRRRPRRHGRRRQRARAGRDVHGALAARVEGLEASGLGPRGGRGESGSLKNVRSRRPRSGGLAEALRPEARGLLSTAA